MYSIFKLCYGSVVPSRSLRSERAAGCYAHRALNHFFGFPLPTQGRVYSIPKCHLKPQFALTILRCENAHAASWLRHWMWARNNMLPRYPGFEVRLTPIWMPYKNKFCWCSHEEKSINLITFIFVTRNKWQAVSDDKPVNVDDRWWKTCAYTFTVAFHFRWATGLRRPLSSASQWILMMMRRHIIINWGAERL